MVVEHKHHYSIGNSSLVVFGIAFLGIFKHFKLDNLHFQGVHIQQHDLTRFLELRHCNQAHCLSCRPFDAFSFELGLVTHKKYVRALVDYKWFCFLKGITPCTLSLSEHSLHHLRAGIQDEFSSRELTQSIRSSWRAASPP